MNIPFFKFFKYFVSQSRSHRKIAERYNKELKGLGLDLPYVENHNKHVYYVYVVSHPQRDKILKELKKRDIHLNISYPWPIHTMEGYKSLGYSEGDLPNTEKLSKTIFSLPMYPTLTDEEQGVVIKSLKEIIEELG